MNKEGLNEFHTTHMHGFGLSIVGIILVVERHTGIIHGIYAAVADSTTEHITGKIGDGIAESVKCFFDMRDPTFTVQQVNKCLPFITVTQMQAVSVKVEFVLVMVSLPMASFGRR